MQNQRAGDGAPRLDLLEPRLLLSGNVVAYAAAGDLFLVGDADSNDIVVTVQGSGGFEVVSGTSTATTINGGSDPVDFTSVTGSVRAFMGAGDDLLSFAVLPPVPGVGDVTATISGDLYVDTGPGNNSVFGDSFIVNGAVTVLNGPGTAATELDSCRFGSLFIQSAGTPIVPAGAVPAGYATSTILHETIVVGDITVLNGLGNDLVRLTVDARNAVVDNGPDAAWTEVTESDFSGSLLLYKEAGAGLIDAPGSTPGASDAGTHAAASYTLIDRVAILGSFVSHDAPGLDELVMRNVRVGMSIDGVGLPDAPGGSVFIDTEEGASYLRMLVVRVNGPTLIKQDGGVDTITVEGGTTTTALLIGPIRTEGVGVDGESDFYGDFTVLNGPGTDGFMAGDAHFFGNLTVLNGPDAAAFGLLGGDVEGTLTWARGDGGVLPSIPTYFDAVGASGGELDDASSYVTLQDETVGGGAFFFNGAGYNYAEITGLTLGGDLVTVNGPGAAYFRLHDSAVGGSATIVDAGSAPLGLGGFVMTTETLIGVIPGNVGGTSDTTIGGNLTVVTGPGADMTEIRSAAVAGSVFVSNGPDGASVELIGSSVGGSLTVLRGDGAAGALTDPLGFVCAGLDSVSGSTIGGAAVFVNGGGSNSVTLAGSVGGDLVAVNGAGQNEFFQAVGTFGGSVVCVVGGASSTYVQVLVGSASSATSVAGNLLVLTGVSGDVVTFRGVSVAGWTTVDTGLGFDTISVDDSAFTGAVALTTGPDFAPAGARDVDQVRIERTTGTAAGTTFGSTLTIKTGVGDDTVHIGYTNTSNAGLGNAANECFAHFAADVSVDGGDGNDTLDYLTGGNVFDGDAVLTDVNVESVV